MQFKFHLLNINISVTKRWNIVKTKGALVKGGFGHSSVYDSVTKVIYVFGGYHSYGASDTILVDLLYSYNPRHQSWYDLKIFSKSVDIYFH